MHDRIARALALMALSCASCRAARSTADAGMTLVRTVAPCAGLSACEKACEAGSGLSCTEAGRLLEYGHGVAPDAGRAFAAYERACALGYSGGCYNEGVLLEAGRGVARDVRRAAVLYARVCAAGSPTACAAARRLARDGGAP